MCLEKPGPRCSGHTRTNFRAATAKLKAASEDLAQKKEKLREVQTEEAREEVRASRKAHEAALSEVADATEKYKTSRENRTVAMDAYRTAKKEYEASPEGIEKNRLRSQDPKQTPAERKQAHEAAIEGALRREDQKKAYEESKGKKELPDFSDADREKLERDLRIKDEKAFIESVRPTEFKARRKWQKDIDNMWEELRDDGVGGVTHHQLELDKAKSWARRR